MPNIEQEKGSASAKEPESNLERGKARILRLWELLGECVLLPIPCGTKGPRFDGWQKVELADMADAGYVSLFGGACNIGVLLGEPSEGLCSIDVDFDGWAETFLAANPRVRDTLRTARVSYGNFWVRIKGDYPPPGKLFSATLKDKKGKPLPLGEWRATGNQTVIEGEAADKGEPEAVAYRIAHAGPVVEINFADLKWPDVKDPPRLEPPPEPDKGKAKAKAASKPPEEASEPESYDARAEIAEKLLGGIDWETGTLGFCDCPGKDQHTAKDGAKDCRVNIDGAPTIFCLHNHCQEAVAEANRELRSAIGRVEHGGKGSGNGDRDTLVATLATFDLVEYDGVRDRYARQFGCRTSTLDKLVAETRKKLVLEKQEAAIDFEAVEPWPEPVDGCALLDDLLAVVQRYAVVSPGVRQP